MELTTPRVQIRPFIAEDTAAIHRILCRCFGEEAQLDDPEALRERASWVQWSSLNACWHARLHQPPYGDLAVVARETGRLVGAVGYVPVLAPFAQLSGWAGQPATAPGTRFTAEVGLFWAIDPDAQRQGYATEAGRALIAHGIAQLHLARIVATTEHDNLASQRVMAKLGMRLERNPLPHPPWLQVVGVITSVDA